MKVTGIKITKRFDDGRVLQAFVRVTLDDILSMNGWKILKFREGLRVMPPSEKGKPNSEGNTTWFDSIQIDTKVEAGANLRKEIEDSILKSYGAKPAPETDEFVDANDEFMDNTPF